MNLRRCVPNSISALSLLFGLLAIFKTFEGDFYWAPIYIFLACIADSCDGRAARMLGVGSGDFGKEVDSLCDMASFGVAPAVMIFIFGMKELGLVGQMAACAFAVGGCMRLARFNCNTGVVHGYFQGMPIPAGACFLAAYVLSGFNFGPYGTAAMCLIVGYILYSEIKFPDFKGKGNPLYRIPVIISLIFGAVLLFLKPGAFPFVGMLTYTFCGVINHIYCIMTGKN